MRLFMTTISNFGRVKWLFGKTKHDIVKNVFTFEIGVGVLNGGDFTF